MNKGGIHSVNGFITVEAKIEALMRKIETPNASQIVQVNLLQTPTCFNCGTSSHVMEECPFLVNPMSQMFEQTNVLYL